MNKLFWRNLFLVLAGVVVGSLVASVTRSVPFLSWLSYGMRFGTDAPVTLNLGILQLTLGADIDITISTVLFVGLFYLVGRKVIRS